MLPSNPFPQSYWVKPGIFCAGQYPGALDPTEHEFKLKGLLDCGIRRVINLIPAGETGTNGKPFVPYADMLQNLAGQRGSQVECLRMGFPDGSVPQIDLMNKILNTIDASIAAGEPVYLHCWGGHGRTSTVVGCYLVRHGDTPEQAVRRTLNWRAPLPNNWYPYESGQAAFVKNWETQQTSAKGLH